MSELRQDRVTGGWVIVAPQRSRRPQARAAGERPPVRPPFDPSCPFCPGNEGQLPGIVTETKSQHAIGWSVRVVPNKYPAVQNSKDARGGDGARPAHGVHQVIIDSPRHDAELASMSADELEVAVAAYRERTRSLLGQDGIAAAVMFRNYGQRAGASLVHPHAQVVALDIVPPRVAAMGDWMKRYHREHGRCATCDELAHERKDGARVVDENDAFIALVPYAAEHPYEIWIVPKRHQASFAALADGELGAFAGLLGSAMRRLRSALDDPPYNFVIDSAPKDEREAPHWHWRLRIVPDIATWGGFELGSGLPINPSSPENDAVLLRGAATGPA
jgi:UDPglucose--hexose-1-phosphate uridylyltransferase